MLCKNSKVFFLLTFSFSKEKVVVAGAGKWNDRRIGGYRSFVVGSLLTLDAK
jgi:hypothetical protein